MAILSGAWRWRRRLDLRAQHMAERLFGCVTLDRLPHGFDAGYDITERMPEVHTIVDVGANVGQSTLTYARLWPAARIYSFEPFSDALAQLKANTASHDRIVCVGCALGAAAGSARVALERGSVNNSLLNAIGQESEVRPGSAVEEIAIRTLDEFCQSERIDRIDLLKVDTEGTDLEVLQGAARLLGGQAISFVQVEAGMNPRNRKHVPLQVLQATLEPLGYSLFGLYDQIPEWSGEARLRFCNAMFVSERDAGRRATRVDQEFLARRRDAIDAGSAAEARRRR
jgi:FkbM family methyltransferase